ncbi:TauD/TfdA dioxygenase family protein [Sphingomonas radiodurans]|uniref:TauD/TfdA dioxygenase family protein n=1 Tax=Sphingomonas radiodurans TaxID=2890321 RepID=UPI001E659871|nr:TauD/TfdA family dioxygenase [Sphingomonas radiodurans]WBH17595.1 TauD/TfdA family dioxygenase [Sphingomonas radiodurans]
MMSVQMQPLSEHVGVEASGVDLNTLGDDAFELLRDAVATRGVLFIRDQSLTPEQHIAFARRWGDIDVNKYFPANGGHPEIAEVRKAETQTTNIGGGWHTDHSYDQAPAMGSILLARETPPTGGDTLFASLGAVFDSLSDGLKATLRGLRAVHSADHIYSADGIYAKTDLASDLKGHDERTRAVHPVVIRHPRTGREILYVNPAFTLHFEGWTREESMPLLSYLYQVAMQDRFHCRVNWAPGSIAIWDNRSTWHHAMNDYHGHRRLMHRITISGEPLN